MSSLGRNGDPVRIEPNVLATVKGKGKKKADDDETAIEGVVYRVCALETYVVWT